MVKTDTGRTSDFKSSMSYFSSIIINSWDWYLGKRITMHFLKFLFVLGVGQRRVRHLFHCQSLQHPPLCASHFPEDSVSQCANQALSQHLDVNLQQLVLS